MELILLEDVRSLGRRGEVVEVKPGYGRNYLIPKGAALEANKANKAFFEQQKTKIDARHAQEREEALAVAAAIGEIKLKIAKRVGEKDTLYGSVTTAEIAELLEKKGVSVPKRNIDLGSGVPAIKRLGDYTLSIDLHMDVVAELTVSVVPEGD